MLNTNLIALATELSDHDLLARIAALAGNERQTTAELLAHLAALDARPSLYAAEGHGSLFTYCTHVLKLSEDAACNRIHAARACRRFPMILDLLARGEVSVTTIRLLREHLTPENHRAVLARAIGRTRREIDALVAELAPRPDAPPSVRRLPPPPVSGFSRRPHLRVGTRQCRARPNRVHRARHCRRPRQRPSPRPLPRHRHRPCWRLRFAVP